MRRPCQSLLGALLILGCAIAQATQAQAPQPIGVMIEKRYGNDPPENGPLVILAKNPAQQRRSCC
jgi:hypothetical protein